MLLLLALFEGSSSLMVCLLPAAASWMRSSAFRMPVVRLSPFSAHFRQKKGKTEVLPYMSNSDDHYSAGVASSVAAGASVIGASASAAAFLGAAGALLRRVFLAGSAAVAIELP